MSYFIVGAVQLAEHADTALATASLLNVAFLAKTRNLDIETSGDIPFYLRELLARQPEFFPSRDISIFIADPASPDNSEGILFPQGVHLSSLEYRKYLATRLANIEGVLAQLTDQDFVDGMFLIFSSSFEQNDERVECYPDEVASVVYERLRKRNWFASFKIVIRSKSQVISTDSFTGSRMS